MAEHLPPPTSGISGASLTEFLTLIEFDDLTRQAIGSHSLSMDALAAQHRQVCLALNDYISVNLAEINRSGPGMISGWAKRLHEQSTDLLTSIGWDTIRRAPASSTTNAFPHLEARNALRSVIWKPALTPTEANTLKRLLAHRTRDLLVQVDDRSSLLTDGNALAVTDAILANLLPDLSLLAWLAGRLAQTEGARVIHGGSSKDGARRRLMEHLVGTYTAVSGKAATGANARGPTTRWFAGLFKQLRDSPEPALQDLPSPLNTIARWVRDAVCPEQMTPSRTS